MMLAVTLMVILLVMLILLVVMAIVVMRDLDISSGFEEVCGRGYLQNKQKQLL